ncbi:hypothetical protein C3489_28735 [Streptomyces sp. Ru71]|uniref:hypothetical protein n=1 Tax=Streptomyces sp. Ru71 TaxID=2080746 RepID=UPI000CDDD79B|nr:hypothetical protein [Streptomyces sp. Ru71]POX47807.1 hypothetical protein C3489_28735 [Streptomyces sp. Ru71]
MLRSTWTRGRRGAVIGASAAVVCAGGVLLATGGGDGREGYAAVGAAGGPLASGTAARPTEDVRLVPLDGRADNAPGEKGSSRPPRTPAESAASAGTAAPDRRTAADMAPGAPAPANASVPSRAPAPASPHGPGAPPAPAPGHTSPQAPPSAGTPSPTPKPAPSPAPKPPPAPAALTWTGPVRAPADQRWCEKVTVTFRNSGGTPVRSGTVTFGTHIIGGLGIDWGTVESTAALPAPIGAGARLERTWTVCVDAWRVPLGMHVETRDVAVVWK